jgi:hypothetical protein
VRPPPVVRASPVVCSTAAFTAFLVG